MLLILEEEHKKHLTFLANLELETLREFLRISVEFIEKGANSRMYQAASNKLSVGAEIIQNSVEGLMHLFIESCRQNISELDFQDSMQMLGFNEVTCNELLRAYLENCKEIRSLIADARFSLPHYQDLQWRLDVQVSSRALRRQVKPLFLIKLHTETNGQKEVKLLETDPVNLIHMTQNLEAALDELKSGHCRRIMRNIK